MGDLTRGLDVISLSQVCPLANQPSTLCELSPVAGESNGLIVVMSDGEGCGVPIA